MNLARFTELADAYGADMGRWPEPEGSAARAWAATRDDARAALDEARRLDAALGAFALAAPGAEVQRRIITRLLAERRPGRRLTGWFAALATLVGAGAIGAGVTAGAALVAVAPAAQPDYHASGLYEQSSFGDFGSTDGTAQDGAGA